MKNKNVKLISCICVISILCSFFSFYAFANSNTISEKPAEESNIHYSHTTKPLKLTPTQNKTNKYSHGNIIEQEYELFSIYPLDTYVVSINVCNGVTLESPAQIVIKESDNKTFTVKFKITDNNFFTDYITVSVAAYLESDKAPAFEASSTIYCLKSGEHDYISLTSFDSLASYSEELTDLIDSQNKAGESSEKISSVKSIARSPNLVEVCGTILWTDSEGNTHPAKNLTVEVYDEFDDEPRATTTTRSSGYYTCDFPVASTAGNLYVTIKVSGLNITVLNAVLDPHKHTIIKTYNLSVGNCVEVPYTFPNNTDLGKAVSVHQAMEMANQYVYLLEEEYMPELRVRFPSDNIPNYNGTFYDLPVNTAIANPTIYVLNGDAFDWDIIQHEYGHFVSDIYNFENSLGGSHFINVNLTTSHSKSNAIKLAWSEGYSTYFPLNVQEKMGAANLNIPNVGDNYYSNTEDSIYNIDIETTAYLYINGTEEVEGLDILLGEANEVVVAAILYDLTDPINSADNDLIQCDFEDIWNIITSNHCTTLSDLVQSLYASYSTSFAFNLGATLEYFKVAAHLNSPLMINSNTPVFSWVKNGGGTSEAAINNSFTLIFYNSSYQKIKEIPVTDNTRTYIQLTKAQWDEVKSLAGSTTFYCCIRANQTNTPATGPYLSRPIQISLS